MRWDISNLRWGSVVAGARHHIHEHVGHAAVHDDFGTIDVGRTRAGQEQRRVGDVLRLTNAGPLVATNVIVSNRMPDGAVYVSASSSQGTCTQDANNVFSDLGVLPRGGTAAVSIVVMPVASGVMTNLGWVNNDIFDPGRTNNRVVTTTVVDEQGGTLQFDPAAYEVDETAGTLNLLVTRTNHVYGVVTVDFATGDGTAMAGTDYVATNGTLILSKV